MRRDAIADAVQEAAGNPMLAAAVEVARHGLPVYPVRPRGKAPLYTGWQRAATTKPERLAQHWRKAPKANVGIACRGLIVLDADSARGEDAVADLGLPPTTTVRTRRGAHFYFAGNAPTVPGVLPDVEVRGKGSGVLGAGSVHPSGFEYRWEIPPWEIEPVTIPDELRQLLAYKQRGGADGGVVVGPISKPGRSVYLLRLAGSLRGKHGIEDVAPVLHAVNETKCDPPLPRAKVEKLASDAAKWRNPPLWVTDPIGFANTDPRLSRDARVMLHLLCYHADPAGKCFPGQRRLASLAGVSTRAIAEALRELERFGRVEVDRRRGRTGNRYLLLPYSATPTGSTAPGVQGGRSSVFTAKTFRANGRDAKDAKRADDERWLQSAEGRAYLQRMERRRGREQVA